MDETTFKRTFKRIIEWTRYGCLRCRKEKFDCVKHKNANTVFKAYVSSYSVRSGNLTNGDFKVTRKIECRVLCSANEDCKEVSKKMFFEEHKLSRAIAYI